MLGTIILPLIVVFGGPVAPLNAAEIELQATHPGYERNYSTTCETDMYYSERTGEWNQGPALLPCIPIACVPSFCENGAVRSDGALYCEDSDEIYPAGHWRIDDWQEDTQPGDSIHYLTEY